MSMPEPSPPPPAAPRPSLLDRLTIQGIIALTICFSVVLLTLLCMYGKVPADGPTIGIVSGTISTLLTLLGIIVKHFYDSTTRPPTTENRDGKPS